MTGFGSTPVSTTSLSNNQFPVSAVAVPGEVGSNLTALEGGPESTDVNGNKTAPASMYVKDGSDVTQGAKADAAITNPTVSASEISLLKGLLTLLAGTLGVSGTVGVSNFPGTQPVSAASLPLPSGAATQTTLASVLSALQGILAVQQADLTTTGTISAAQPVIGTPMSNATVALALAEGQSTWKAQLLAGGGGFTSGTTMVVDKSLDGGTTWLTSSFKVGGSLTNTTVQSIVGPGPLELSGNASGVSHVRIRCSVLNSTETIAVTLRGGAGTGDVGLISSIPAGSNNIGSVNVANFPGTQPVSAASLPLPAGAAQEAGNLATIAGIVSSNKAAVKAASGDFVAGSIADLAHGQAAMAASVPVSVASDQTPKTTATATRSNVAGAASDTALLASNGSRKGATFFNDSTAILYLAYGSGTASTSSYSVQVSANGYFELPPEPIFTGAIRGIWSAANGNVRITENS